MIVVGLIGKQGAGKNAFVQILRQLLSGQKNVAHVVTSSVLVETLQQWKSLAGSRENLQKIASAFKDYFGSDVIAKEAKARIDEQLEERADIVVLDCIRWQADLDLVKSYPNHLLVHIDTTQPVRFERIKARKEKEGEGETTWEQFLKTEDAPTEVCIDGFAKQADFTIGNDRSMEKLRESVKMFLSFFI